MIEHNTEKDMWRTLVRVVAVEDHAIWFTISAHMPGVAVLVSKEILPTSIVEQSAEGKKFHAMCNIGCNNIRDLRFEKWEDK
jgi:predicted RNA-binding protein YlxR (DUF448 family)